MNVIDLPNELLYEIIKWLPNKDYYNLILSNSAFNVLSENDINHRKYKNKTLKDVCKNGDLNGVKYLISLGVDIHAEDDSAFITSVVYNHIELVEYFISLGVDINVNDKLAGRMSIFCGYSEMYKFLASFYPNSYVIVIDESLRSRYITSKNGCREWLNKIKNCGSYYPSNFS